MPDETALTPAAVLAAPQPALRGCGLSERKASYLQELAAHFADGRLSDELLTGMALLLLIGLGAVGSTTSNCSSTFTCGRYLMCLLHLACPCLVLAAHLLSHHELRSMQWLPLQRPSCHPLILLLILPPPPAPPGRCL